MATKHNPEILHVGIDVGSTTTKAVVLDAKTGARVYSSYARHGARQIESVRQAISQLGEKFNQSRLRVALCGSGGDSIAKHLKVPFVQEVVAGAIAVRKLYARARCVIELGGQDAKMVFFRHDEATGSLEVEDMRMNGSCAGGTGAFVDEIAALLGVGVEELDGLAARGKPLYDISGRCGVYAKSDIQPLLNQGAAKADLVLSAFHAIAKQTIGGLAQGIRVKGPAVFQGGPLTFNPTLVRVFAEHLGLDEDGVIVPEHAETIVAQGAALSLSGLFAEADASLCVEDAMEALDKAEREAGAGRPASKPFFASPAERADFEARHARPVPPSLPEAGDARVARAGGVLPVHLGIDAGSTTTKFAVLDDDGELVDAFYASNAGEPLEVACHALVEMRDRHRSRGVELQVVSCGTTGYGEQLFARGLHADYHVVETVAHARAATRAVPDASFVLDIGGQDMKAMWIEDGIVRDIVVNEACSSGCGSFLEGFAASFGMPVEDIAQAAFRSKDPAVLGSRCTVFMNSSVVSEQREGKTSDDIMAGLCRSIVENVFTKVIRVSNLDSLGPRVVVQGGTFENDAVLRAFEQYLGRDVARAPHPGLMGAIGVALLAREAAAERRASSFVGFDALKDLSFTRESNVPCPFCGNHCARTVVRFSDGTSWVSGNRCERGEELGDAEVPPRACATRRRPANLFAERRGMLLRDYSFERLASDRNVTIGIPLVLSFWETLPFWKAFFGSLGFTVQVSGKSTRELYEDGLPSVTSDTVCFPAKLVHGHVRALARQGVDRIFMPIITAVPSENREETSESMCAVVKGYPMVVKSSDDPARRLDTPFDMPLFHWHSDADRDRQLADWMRDTFGIESDLTRAAIEQGDGAQNAFKQGLERRGAEVLAAARDEGRFAVVLASRPYHNDPFVNHGLPEMVTGLGVDVLPPDAVPDLGEEDLSLSRLDIVNNYHARMLASALRAARSDELEYMQLVSFGCGHDAYLSDEIIRLMREVSGKVPLVLKMDETDAQGPLRIRVRSFLETVNRKRARTASASAVHALSDPYPVKFERDDCARRVVLVPNVSRAFCRVMSAVFSKQGLRAEPLDMGGEEAMRLGKRYVHNDVCFPAQVTIGEALAALESGRYDGMDVAVGTGKYIGDCRLTHYAALLRKALDDAGYSQVPIVTNDDVDSHHLHPGFRMSLPSSVRIAFALPMIDALEELLRKMRPYELEPGSAQRAFDAALDALIEGLQAHGVRGAARGFKEGIRMLADVRYDRSCPRPRVLVVGEYLLNFHPGANHGIEAYLEDNGMEVIEARMTDVIRKTYFYQDAQVREFKVKKPLAQKAWLRIANAVFERAHDLTDRIACAHPLYERACRLPELVRESDPIMHHTFDAGEGVLIPGEILHHAKKGCRSFVILGPFGCLPNHVCGRGIVRQLKERYPDANILALDYDPDASFANIENRLQMLVMNACTAQ